MAAIKIPDELKVDMPPTFWGKVLSATPIVMTVVATALAGLASSEMTRAQYSRSLAAQQQSKAGDQWGFFQAKRLRGAMQRSTLDLLQSTAELQALDAAAFAKLGVTSESPEGRQTLAALLQGQLPDLGPVPSVDPALKAALESIESSKPESEVLPLVAKVNDKALEEALGAAKDRARELETSLKPINQTVDRIERQMAADPGGAQANRNFIAARLRYAALRYDAEARLNQAIAALYEVQVRRNNLDAERHHKRSQRFFYGMLATQAAVIISTFAIAARKRNLLWSLAAAAGAGAVSFAVWVYLFV